MRKIPTSATWASFVFFPQLLCFFSPLVGWIFFCFPNFFVFCFVFPLVGWLSRFFVCFALLVGLFVVSVLAVCLLLRFGFGLGSVVFFVCFGLLVMFGWFGLVGWLVGWLALFIVPGAMFQHVST